MREHELRRQVVGEMHLRRWPQLALPGLIVMWVITVDDDERGEELSLIDSRAEPTPELANPAHREGRLSKRIAFAWERHSEGTSISLFVRDVAQGAFLDPASDDELAQAIAWVETLPGRCVRATRIWVCESESEGEDLAERAGFERPELVSCRIDGRARAWSDFRIHADDFGKLIVAANGTHPRDFTRQVQSLQELGNYRNRALLGLPLAKASWRRIDDAEARLRDLSRRISEGSESDDALMAELSGLSFELMEISTSIGFRMNATAAYARLVTERLTQLKSEAIPGYASLTDFAQRRFLPAVNTCATTVERERGLSLRAAQLTSLLRTRIETRIENQNAEVLRSMARSTAMQLRMQQLVEGLSVIALSYYAIGLIGYLLKGMEHRWPGIDAVATQAALVIPVVVVAWVGIRVIKRRVLRPE
jgi:uncharacterized membrane-anchored protein